MPGDVNHAVRQNEAQNLPMDADTDPAPAGVDGTLDVVPGPGGYAGRDPKTEMPRVPSAPETQRDSGDHDAAPGPGPEQPAHG